MAEPSSGIVQKHWWKILAVVLIMYTIGMGFLGKVPALFVLNETIRNLYFHVTMWFGMMALLSVSVYHSIAYLGKPLYERDLQASSYATTGLLFGILGIATGSVWARFTWGACIRAMAAIRHSAPMIWTATCAWFFILPYWAGSCLGYGLPHCA